MTSTGERRSCSCCGGSETAVPEASKPTDLLCYCFGYSQESLKAEWVATGRLDSVEAIRAAIKEGRCRCAEMNPSGTCCLGDVLEAVREIQGATAPRPGRG
jgi:hypothetical protein